MILARQLIALHLLAIFVFPGGGLAAPYNQLILFGDSLSDVGNVDNIPFSPYPGDGYWQGRFSNGPVYAEHLAIGLGLDPLVRSGAGGTNYAFGGAQTAGTGGITGLFLNDVDEQVEAYLQSQTIDPSALYVVFAGANDFFNGQMDAQVPVNQLQQQIMQLANAGVTQLLVPNLPLLGETPAYRNNSTQRQAFNELAIAFNSGLATMLKGVEVAYDDLTIFRLDVAHFFGEAMANPAAYGLANATQQAAAGLEPGMWSYDLDQIVENPEEYLFWDHVHPTATGHALLGDLALSLVALPGDFNRDGVVDAADYTLWRNSLGATVTSGTGADANGDAVVDWSDYELWKRHYGQEASFLVLGGRNVPEPMSAILLIGIIAAATLSSYPYFALGRGGGRSQ